jgi:hypothetical protein
LNGYCFSFFSFDKKSLQSALNLLNITSFSGDIISLSSFPEAVRFLSHPISRYFDRQFEISCGLVAQNFSNLTSKSFSKLTNRALEKILSLESLNLSSETFLLQKILENPEKKQLAKFVLFPAVDYQALLQFIQDLDIDDIDLELFKILKQLFYFPHENISRNR